MIDPRSILARLGGDFSDFSVVFWSGVSTRSKMRRHAKNLQKPMVFTGFSRIRSCAHEAKIDRKSFRTHFPSDLRDGSLAERSFSELRSVKMVPEGSPERLERRLGTLLGALGPLLGCS